MSKILFQTVESGYDKFQVDGYIDKLSEAYRVAYDENQVMQSRYSGMLEDYKKLEQQVQAKLNSKVIAKTMLDVEMLAQKIIEEANSEAEDLKAEALKTLDDAYAKAAEIEVNAKKLTDEAVCEKNGAESVARQIVEEARAEAADMIEKAKNNIDEAQEIINKTISRAQNLISAVAPWNKTGAA